jgi:hypothetical protein
VDPTSEDVYWIAVWVYQKVGGKTAAARGSKDWGNSPVTPKWECPTTLFQASNEPSNRFTPGPALGMAVAVVKDGNKKKYFGWWDNTEIVP